MTQTTAKLDDGLRRVVTRQTSGVVELRYRPIPVVQLDSLDTRTPEKLEPSDEQ